MAEKYEGRKFETVFVADRLPDDSRIAEIMEWGARLHAMGLLPDEHGGHAGNMSFRNSRGFVITAGGVGKGTLKPADFVQVLSCNVDTRKVEAEGQLEPSSETLTHHMIYRERPEINAVVHVHDSLVICHAAELRLGETGREHPYGTPELAREVADSLGHRKYLVVKGHGVIAVGRSLWEACMQVITVHGDASALQGK